MCYGTAMNENTNTETELHDYYCYYCPTCSSEYAGWGDLPEGFDPDNWCDCPSESV